MHNDLCRYEYLHSDIYVRVLGSVYEHCWDVSVQFVFVWYRLLDRDVLLGRYTTHIATCCLMFVFYLRK